MNEHLFEEKFDDFRIEVIDRLARIETRQERIFERLDWINGAIGTHEKRLDRHDRRFARLHGASSVIAALVAAAMSAVLGRLRVWLNL